MHLNDRLILASILLLQLVTLVLLLVLH